MRLMSAPRVALLLWEQEVGGSNPPVPTSFINFLVGYVRGFMRGFCQEQVFIQQFEGLPQVVYLFS